MEVNRKERAKVVGLLDKVEKDKKAEAAEE